MQRSKQFSGWFVGCVCLSAAMGCAGASEAPDVNYADGTAIGRWQTDGAAGTATNIARAAAGSNALPATAGTVASTGPVSSTSPAIINTAAPSSPTIMPPAAGSPALPTSSQPSAGRAAMSGGGAGAAAMTKPPAAAGAPADPGSSGSAIKSLAFEVTTSPVGLRYQPKNIGAIWIQDSSGAFVKSLQVWARVRSRWLTKYNAARGSQAVDVTASATLTSHQAHSVTWDMKDRSGAAVPPGKYTLFVELTDGDATGKFTSVDFDTSSAPKSSNPPDAPSFSGMKLDLK